MPVPSMPVRRLTSALAAVAIAASTAGCEQVLNECEELVVGDTVFMGKRHRVLGATTYFRALYSPGASEVPPLRFIRVGQHTTSIHGVTPASLRERGFPELTSPSSSRRHFGVNCNDDAHEANLGVSFTGDALAHVGGVSFGTTACDFAIGWNESAMFALPIDGQRLRELSPAPGVLRECRPPF